MKNLSPQAIAQKWADRMNGASTAYTQGVQAFQGNPMQLAAAQVNTWMQRLQAAQGKWVASLNRTPKEVWLQNAVNLGASRLGPGATQAVPKVTSFWTAFLPTLVQATQQVKAMPNATYEQRKARANAMMDALHAFKRT